MKAIDFDTGNGLMFTVLPGRGLDISRCSYRGANLVYLGAAGETHATYYEPQGRGWLRGFFGGLLTTCGMRNFGPPDEDAGEQLGLHGRFSHTPARQVCDLSGWKDDSSYEMCVRGTVEDSVALGNKIRLTRTISTMLGSRTISITDNVENVGAETSPLMMLYHMNAGFPLLDESAEFFVRSRSCTPLTDGAKSQFDDRFKFSEPKRGALSNLFVYEVEPDETGMGRAAIFNRNLQNGLGLMVEFDTTTLPYLAEWKLMGEQDYVLGIEPCNAPVEPRSQLRQKGLLPFIEPGESRNFSVTVRILDGPEEIQQATGIVPK